MASTPSIGLLRETATIKDVVRALNNFYDEFLEQNIRLNLDHANQEDINDGELNKQNATRVSSLKVTCFNFMCLKYSCYLFILRLPALDFRVVLIQTIWLLSEPCSSLWLRSW